MTCECDFCSRLHPMVKSVRAKLVEPEAEMFQELVNNWISAEHDAEYWELKYKGDWPHGRPCYEG